MDDIPGTNNAYAIMDDDNEVCIVEEGQDVAELLGVTKYEPPIPSQLAGEVFNAGTSVGVNYDIEDFKNFPDVLKEGEEVQMTVKLHGTNCQVVWLHPDKGTDEQFAQSINLHEWIKVFNKEKLIGYIAIGSKGLGGKGLFFKDNEANTNNVYLRAFRKHLVDFAQACYSTSPSSYVTMVGEVFGPGIQSFNYGLSDISFRAFDVYQGLRGQGNYLYDLVLDSFCTVSKVPRVPIVYRGPFSYEIMHKLANDKETSFENVKHVREGVIVKPVEERYDPELGRVALKHRSEKYMLGVTGEEVQ
jgi:RNA ligase (TIGR02306 family)